MRTEWSATTNSRSAGQQFAEAQAYSQRLATNLGSGRYDWPEAQAMEKQLLDSANGDDASATQPNP